jgi:gluconate 5-dehydrogenase
VTSELARETTAPYAAAKGGLKMLTRAMCAEWARHGIQANAIAPGYFDTDLTQALTADVAFDAWLRARVPAGRWGVPADLGGAVVFFASSASDYVNGQILYVDGGLTAVV